jgi:hypothetical protein
MRIHISKGEQTLQKLSEAVSRRPAAAGATLERIAALNPHLANLDKLAPGTVVLLPDSPELKAGAGTALGTDNLIDLVSDVTKGVKAAGTRASSKFESIAADHAAVAKALKTEAVKKIVDGDPLLKQKLAAAEATFKAEQKREKEARAAFEDIQSFAVEAFEKLSKQFDR